MNAHDSDQYAEPGLDALMRERRQLINLGYRMLGSLGDAEDVVQETYARWYAMPSEQRSAIDAPGAWLTKVASRICLDLLGSARARRERYVGEWLPEPVPDGDDWLDGPSGAASVDPADRVTLDESINMAFLVVLDSMTPAERVAFILHDVFRYPFADIGEIVGRTPAACRQLATSARRRIRAAHPSDTSPAPRSEVVRRFKRAWESNDINALISLLDPDAVATADGGGLVSAAAEPIVGGDQIAAYFIGLLDLGIQFELAERMVNGQPGLIVQVDKATSAVLAFDVADERVSRIWAVRNPEKLRPWTGDERPD